MNSQKSMMLELTGEDSTKISAELTFMLKAVEGVTRCTQLGFLAL